MLIYTLQPCSGGDFNVLQVLQPESAMVAAMFKCGIRKTGNDNNTHESATVQHEHNAIYTERDTILHIVIHPAVVAHR